VAPSRLSRNALHASSGLWGSLAACGGLLTRVANLPERRRATGAQP